MTFSTLPLHRGSFGIARGAAITMLFVACAGCGPETADAQRSPISSAGNESGTEVETADPPLPGDDLLALDTHVDIPLDFATDAVDPLDADLQVNLEKMRAGGLDAAFFIVYVGQTERTPDNYAAAAADAMTKFNAIHRMTDELYPDQIGFAASPDEVERLHAEGKLAAAIGIENGYVIGTDLSLLDRYYELGARYVTLVHNGHNDLADSAQPRPDLGDEGPEEHGGVSDLGAAAIERMNALGIMVDVSHASKQSALEAISLSRAPVIASHSSIRGVTEHPRNMDDETLMALRDNGGVVQVVAFDPYVKYQPEEQIAAMAALRERVGVSPRGGLEALSAEQQQAYSDGLNEIEQRWPRATVADFVDHIDYAVKLIGVDHVGISSDFGGGGGVVGWNDAAETQNVTDELRRRGYSDADIGKIWSGNLLRVWAEVQSAAEDPTAQ